MEKLRRKKKGQRETSSYAVHCFSSFQFALLWFGMPIIISLFYYKTQQSANQKVGFSSMILQQCPALLMIRFPLSNFLYNLSSFLFLSSFSSCGWLLEVSLAALR